MPLKFVPVARVGHLSSFFAERNVSEHEEQSKTIAGEIITAEIWACESEKGHFYVGTVDTDIS